MVRKLSGEKVYRKEDNNEGESNPKKVALANYLGVDVESLVETEYDENAFKVNPKPAKRGSSPVYYVNTVKEFKALIGPEGIAAIDAALASDDPYSKYKEVSSFVPKTPVIKDWIYNVNILYWLLYTKGETHDKMIKAWKDENIEDDREDYEDNSGEYLVLTEGEADDKAIEREKQTLDEIGVEGLRMNWRGYVKKKWFKDVLKESQESYVENIESESSGDYENRLVGEMYDAGILTDEDFVSDEDGNPDYMNTNPGVVDGKKSDFVDWLVDRASDPIDDYISNFGEENFNNIVKEKNLIDMEGVAREIIETDGRGQALSSYDGEENEEVVDGETYYIYRQS